MVRASASTLCWPTIFTDTPCVLTGSAQLGYMKHAPMYRREHSLIFKIGLNDFGHLVQVNIKKYTKYHAASLIDSGASAMILATDMVDQLKGCA